MCSTLPSEIRSTTQLSVVASAILALAGACHTGGSGPGDNDGTGDGPSGDVGVLMGQVWSVDGIPIPGVAVTLNNGRSTSTEDNGLYSFSDLEPGEKNIASFRQAAFATTAKALVVDAADSATPSCIIMARAADTVTISADTDTTQRSGDSAVTIPAGSLVDGNGNAVTGDVQLTLSSIQVRMSDVPVASTWSVNAMTLLVPTTGKLVNALQIRLESASFVRNCKQDNVE